LLSSLVGKSLVMREDANGLACYRLHETMREFARLKLGEAGEQEAVELRCAEYYRSRCQRPRLEGRYRLLEWLGWADLEIDNIRAVLRWCLSRADTARGIDLAVSLGWYWVTRATTEGMRWLDGFLASAGGDSFTRARAYFIRGFLGVLKGDPAAARPALREAVAAARQAGLRDLLSEALSLASIAETMAGDHASAKRLLDEAHLTTTGLDYPSGRLAVLQAQALNGLFEADLDAVRAGASEGARLAREAGDLYGLEMMLLNLGSAALIAGDLDESRPRLAEALRIADQIDDRVAQFYLLGAFGCHAAFSGQPRLAAQLLGAADTVRTRVGANVMQFLAPSLARAGSSAAMALGATRFEAELEAGKRLSRDTARELALGEHPHGAAASGNASTGPLGKRETDVARLIADGLTNKQVGTRLFISERTVDSHVRSILNKLGFNSRAQIAAWMTSPDK
jgi:ATP/maltotriose-dependent transcriptional regulator MalT